MGCFLLKMKEKKRDKKIVCLRTIDNIINTEYDKPRVMHVEVLGKYLLADLLIQTQNIRAVKFETKKQN